MSEPDKPAMMDLERQWRQDLRSLEARIDPPVTQQLSDARRKALAAARPRRRLGPRWLAPATGMAFACGLSLWVLAPHLPIASHWQISGPASGQAPLTTEAAELYEDLDFYSWLANNPAEIDQG